MLRIKCQEEGEVIVSEDIKKRWSIFDNRLEGTVNEGDDNVIEVPFPLHIIAGWLQIDYYCKLCESSTSFTFSKFDAVQYTPICRFMDSVDGLFWLFLTVGNADEGLRRELYLAICNTMNRLDDEHPFFHRTGDLFTTHYYPGIQRQSVEVQDDDLSLAVRMVHNDAHEDDYLFGNMNLYLEKRNFPLYIQHILMLLPRPSDMAKRREALATMELIRQSKKGEEHHHLNDLISITGLPKKKRDGRANLMIRTSGLSYFTNGGVTKHTFDTLFPRIPSKYTLRMLGVDPITGMTSKYYIVPKCHLVNAVASMVRNRHVELLLALNICKLYLRCSKGEKRFNQFMQILQNNI